MPPLPFSGTYVLLLFTIFHFQLSLWCTGFNSTRNKASSQSQCKTLCTTPLLELTTQPIDLKFEIRRLNISCTADILNFKKSKTTICKNLIFLNYNKFI